MPYADPEKQREAKARWYREKYHGDAEFRENVLEYKRELWKSKEHDDPIRVRQRKQTKAWRKKKAREAESQAKRKSRKAAE